MPVSVKPIFAREINELSSPGRPFSVETKKGVRLDRPLGHGWLEEHVIEPGFWVNPARYESYQAYNIHSILTPRFRLTLNFGAGMSARLPREEYFLPSGNFGVHSFDEPLTLMDRRGEQKSQERCSFSVTPEWIAAGNFEQFDETGVMGRTIARHGAFVFGPASPSLLSAASRLFAAFEFEGALAGLHREAASLAFFAESFASLQDTRPNRSVSRLEVGRIMRVKEMLDNLSPDVDVRLVELAAHHGMSVRSLCRHFRVTFGTTVAKYIASNRMERARVGLERNHFSIDHAAFTAGFAHTSNFTAAFRRRYGYLPGTARRIGAAQKF